MSNLCRCCYVPSAPGVLRDVSQSCMLRCLDTCGLTAYCSTYCHSTSYCRPKYWTAAGSSCLQHMDAIVSCDSTLILAGWTGRSQHKVHGTSVRRMRIPGWKVVLVSVLGQTAHLKSGLEMSRHLAYSNDFQKQSNLENWYKLIQIPPMYLCILWMMGSKVPTQPKI